MLVTEVKPHVGYTIATILNKPLTKGDVGIEIECEGNKFQKNDLPHWWEYHKDGSLRGLDNAEYVLAKPIFFDQVPEAVGDLWTMMNKYGTVLDVSNRTSVHVHLNVQNFHLNRLCSFLALYFAVEEVLTQWCGDHRVGNLFCLRARDAENIIRRLRKFIASDGLAELPDGMHYAGLNAQALQKFGSIEIRSLYGCTEPETILRWVSILRNIYDISANWRDPRDIPGLMSSGGAYEFFKMVVGNDAEQVRLDIDWSTQQVKEAIYRGIRIAQGMCYCRDWSLFKEDYSKPDPFQRPVSTVAAHHQAYIDALSPGSTVMSAYAAGNNYNSLSGTNWQPIPSPAHSLVLNTGFNYVAQAQTTTPIELTPEILADEDLFQQWLDQEDTETQF